MAEIPEKTKITIARFKQDVYYLGLFIKESRSMVGEEDWANIEISDTPFLKDCYDRRHIGEVQQVRFRLGELDEFNKRIIQEREGISLRIPDLELVLRHKSFLDSLRNQRIFETIKQWADKNGFRNPRDKEFYLLKPEVYLFGVPHSDLGFPYESGILELHP